MPTTPIRELLNEAADYIEAHGWVRGQHRDNFGRVCALGALSTVANGRATLDAERHLLDYLHSTSKKVPTNFLTVWNDGHAKNGKEVVASFREAAAWTE